MGSLKKVARNVVLGVGGLVTLLSGCNEELANSLASTAWHQTTISGVSRIIEGPRGTTVNVNQGVASSVNQGVIPNINASMYDPKLFDYMCFFIYNQTVDINRDGIIDFNSELFGAKKTVFNIDREKMTCVFYKRDGGELTLESWTSDGRKLGETKYVVCPEGYIQEFSTGPEWPTQGDFMDNIKGAGAGDYRITARDDRGIVISTEVKVERDVKTATGN